MKRESAFIVVLFTVLALSACNHPTSPTPQHDEETPRPVSAVPLPATLRLVTGAGAPTRMWATLKEATIIGMTKNPEPFDLDCGDRFVYLMEVGVDGPINGSEKGVFQIFLRDDSGGERFLEIGSVSASTSHSVMIGGGIESRVCWCIKDMRPTHLAVSGAFRTTVILPPIEEGSTSFDLQR